MASARDRISMKPGLDGTVLHAPAGKPVSILGDDGKPYTAKAGTVLRPAGTPVPRHLAETVEELVEAHARVWKKGDRAEIDHGGKTLKGTIERGGGKPVMVIDGGTEQISAPSVSFRPGEPLDLGDAPSVMDRWSVRNYRANDRLSQETVCYTAEVLLDGKVVIRASNSGTGGCDRLMPVEGAPRGVADALADDAKQWYSDHGIANAFEPESSWISWYANRRPYGVSAAAFMDEERESYARLSGPAA